MRPTIDGARTPESMPILFDTENTTPEKLPPISLNATKNPEPYVRPLYAYNY